MSDKNDKKSLHNEIKKTRNKIEENRISIKNIKDRQAGIENIKIASTKIYQELEEYAGKSELRHIVLENSDFVRMNNKKISRYYDEEYKRLRNEGRQLTEKEDSLNREYKKK